MKKIYIALSILVFNLTAFAQNKEAVPTIEASKYMEQLIENVILPASFAQKVKSNEILTTVSLSISENGDVTDVNVLNDRYKIKPYLKNALTTLPKWEPKMENGKAVASKKIVKLAIPISQKDMNNLNSLARPTNGYATVEDTFRKGLGQIRRNKIKFELDFTVTEQGQLTDLTVKNLTDPKQQKRIEKLFSELSDWTPAIENGIPVRSKVFLPIVIQNN